MRRVSGDDSWLVVVANFLLGARTITASVFRWRASIAEVVQHRRQPIRAAGNLGKFSVQVCSATPPPCTATAISLDLCLPPLECAGVSSGMRSGSEVLWLDEAVMAVYWSGRFAPGFRF